MKVKNFYNKNQFIIEGLEGITFQSYNSEIANIDKKGNLILGIDWDYSNTTLKHLYLFLNDYFYNLNYNTRELLRDLTKKSNRKAYIQKLIDKKLINYNENMR